MVQGRIDGIIAWLAEHRFIVRTGEDPTVAKRLAENEAVEIDEDWDDEKPLWAQSAESIEGVGLQEIVETKPRPKRPAVIGFQTAGELSTPLSDEIIPDSPAMTYAATPFGERVSRLYLDPLSGLILRRACAKHAKFCVESSKIALFPRGRYYILWPVHPIFPHSGPLENKCK